VNINPTVDHEGAPPDVALVHELEHARHGTQGIMQKGLVDDDGGGVRGDGAHGFLPSVSRAEHQVIGIGGMPQVPREGGLTENQYRQERGLAPRASYRFPGGMSDEQYQMLFG
jgi:hypothetical protein